jgi:magnesium-protoporphyrin IX monomethyl ester (oxidative) cyclase
MLDLMRKGVTAIANVQTLKCATEAGIWLIWAILCGIPGEKPEYYDRMAALFPKIYHLNPPKGILEVTIDRHSPLHQEPAKYGMRLEPAKAYRYLYGLPEPIVEELAYWFEDRNSVGGRTDYYQLPDYVKSCQRRIQIWQTSYLRSKDVRLDYEIDGERLSLVDTRSGVEKEIAFTGLKKSIVESTMQIATFARIRRAVLRSSPTTDDEAVQRALDELVDASYILREGGKYLFLGLSRAALNSRQPSGFWLEQLINNEDYTFA